MSIGHPYVKNEKFRETCPISIYDVAAVETWLEDLARRGYCPIGFTGIRADLLPDEPRESRFRLQPLQRWKEALDPERVSSYQAMGWQLVGQLGPFWVWRCDDPDALELDTDPVVQGEGYRYLRRRMLRRTVVGDLFWLGLLAITLWAAAFGSLYTLLRSASWAGVFARPLLVGAALVLVPVELWLEFRDTRRLWKTLTAGIPLERPRPYRRRKLERTVHWLTVAVLVVNLGINLADLLGPSGWNHTRDILEEGQPPAEAVTVNLAELEGLEPIWHEAAEKTLPIAPEMYTTGQYAYFPLIGPVMARSDYYCLKTEELARRLAADLTQAQGLAPQPIPEGVTNAPDGFWWVQETTGDTLSDQYAVLLRGREVLAVIYHGVKDLRESVPYLASLLPD